MRTANPFSEQAHVAEAAKSGALVVQRCTRCRRWIWFPRAICPNCFEHSLEWRRASGRGTVLSFAVIHRTHDERYEPFVPIVLALIRLDEGCEMVATVVREDRARTRVGDRVRLATSERWSQLDRKSVV